jgi:hypothetical protein
MDHSQTEWLKVNIFDFYCLIAEDKLEESKKKILELEDKISKLGSG